MINSNFEINDSCIKFKLIFSGKILITYFDTAITYEGFLAEVKEICNFHNSQPFTVKWIDDEGDPCTISSEAELAEALRWHNIIESSEILLYEALYKYRPRRYKKLYRHRGHVYEAKRFKRRAACAYCTDHIWGLGRQGLRCTQCKLLAHKKCHRLINIPCSISPPNADLSLSLLIEPPNYSILNEAGWFDTEQNSEARSFVGDDSSPKRSNSKYLSNPTYQNASKSSSPFCVEPAVSLKNFEMLRVIGKGSYAKVFLVQNRITCKKYAMKVIKKKLVVDDEDMDWVQTEKHIFELASNHPFLVGLHSCFQTPSRLFFVIELVGGGDMMLHMQRMRKLPESHVKFYSAEVSLALRFLHERGIIYRDLKLDNVLLDTSGHVKLTDYGMCKEGLGPGETTSTFCGTPNYIAPEILRREEYDNSVDWWSLGILMYEMLAGRSPFDLAGHSDYPDLNTEDYLFQVILESPIRLPRSLSSRASAILKGLLNKNPRERLACHPCSDFEDFQGHVFYEGLNWDLLFYGRIEPPYKVPKGDIDLFDPEFENEPVEFTPDDKNDIDGIDQSEFEGFEYVNPLLMTAEECV